MNKRELVQLALEKGIMLTPEMLGQDSGALEKTIEDAMGTGKMVVGSAVPPSRTQITVKIKKQKPVKKLKPQDMVQFYGQKYTTLRDILKKKLKVISINKAKDNYSDVAVIGMVKEHTSSGFVLEGPTGEIEVVAKDKPVLDDVVGVKGSVREGKLILQETVLPDVPLDNMSERITGMNIVLSHGAIDDNADLIFTEEKTDREKDIHVETNPAQVTISRGEKKILMLVYKPPKTATLKEGVEWLKKRCLPHKREDARSADNKFLIKKVPAILWVLGAEPGKELYKGVTVIGCGKSAARVKLETMDVQFKE